MTDATAFGSGISLRHPLFQNIYAFALFNALSFQIVLGNPMILYAKLLHANGTTLGLIAGMTSLLVILQIPAARYVDAAGCKRFVLSGWSIRTVFVLLIALLPLSSGWLPGESRLVLLLGLLFLFNLARGISSCGWLPWISSIIPAELRGRYLTHDASIVNLASLSVLWLAAVLLGSSPAPSPWRFSVLFAFSGLCAMGSLRFLQRIPPETRQETRELPPRPRLRQMLRHPGFAPILAFNVFLSLASGGVNTFVVAYLKDLQHWPEQRILQMTSLVFLGGLSNQLLLPRILDRHGSKPVIVAAALLWAGVVFGWVLTSGGKLSGGMVPVAFLLLGAGLANSMINLSNLRLVMLTVPEVGRSHYFATYSVLANVILGCAPVGWGMLLDGWGARSPDWAGLDWNRYTLLFANLLLMFGATAAMALFLIEPGAVQFRQLLDDVLSKSRIRFWLRTAFRVPPRG